MDGHRVEMVDPDIPHQHRADRHRVFTVQALDGWKGRETIESTVRLEPVLERESDHDRVWLIGIFTAGCSP